MDSSLKVIIMGIVVCVLLLFMVNVPIYLIHKADQQARQPLYNHGFTDTEINDNFVLIKPKNGEPYYQLKSRRAEDLDDKISKW